jgi:hypothetical protein
MLAQILLSLSLPMTAIASVSFLNDMEKLDSIPVSSIVLALEAPNCPKTFPELPNNIDRELLINTILSKLIVDIPTDKVSIIKDKFTKSLLNIKVCSILVHPQDFVSDVKDPSTCLSKRLETECREKFLGDLKSTDRETSVGLVRRGNRRIAGTITCAILGPALVRF